MARAAQNQAKKTFNESQGVFGTSQGNANDLYSKLFPMLESEATNPQGYSKGDLAAMNTASQQSIGGSTAGAVGEGNLEGARTRNAGSFAPALDEAVRSGERTASENALGVQEQNANLKEAQKQSGIAGLSGLYGQNTSDMLSALGLGNQATGALTEAGKSGWYQNLMNGIATTSEAFKNVMQGIASCPAFGSMYLMADGTEKPVEELEVGDQLMGIDGELQTIEEIQIATTPILKVETEDGFVARNSRVHAFALPAGGFAVAMYALGKMIRTAKGTAKVVRVDWDGEDTVFNVITDGSHTYRADGVWALGVGEAERQVSMQRWNQIGDRLMDHV